MDKQQYYDGKDPHLVTPVICLNCRKEWMAVHPLYVKVEQLECPGCGEQGYAGGVTYVNLKNYLKIKHERKKKIEFLKAHPLCIECNRHGDSTKSTSVFWITEEKGVALCDYHLEVVERYGFTDDVASNEIK